VVSTIVLDLVLDRQVGRLSACPLGALTEHRTVLACAPCGRGLKTLGARGEVRVDFLEEGAKMWNSYRGSSWQGELTPLELKAALRLRASLCGVARPQGCHGPAGIQHPPSLSLGS